MSLPTDGHVHTEWSWDTITGSMLGSCERAIELGLPSVAFTEHADLTPWLLPEPIRPLLPDHFRVRLRPDGVLEPPELDVPGYLACVKECRERFPDLRILSGVELSEGGAAVAFGSDAHEPRLVGHGFKQAAALVESCGFRPGRTPHDFWHR